MLDLGGKVYHIHCSDCPEIYLWESERLLGTRLQEHKRPRSVSSHVSKEQHRIDWNGVKVPGSGS